jgi:hypothetical protein
MKTRSWVLVAYTCNPSYLGGRDQEDHSLKPAGVGETLSQKYPTQKRAGRVDQVVEYLPSKCDALSLSPSTTKKKKKKEKKNRSKSIMKYSNNVIYPLITKTSWC